MRGSEFGSSETDDEALHICGDYRSVLNLRLIKCASTKKDPGQDMKFILGSRYFLKIDLQKACLQIPVSPEFKPLSIILITCDPRQAKTYPIGDRVLSRLFQTHVVIRDMNEILHHENDLIVLGSTKYRHDLPMKLLPITLMEKNVSCKTT